VAQQQLAEVEQVQHAAGPIQMQQSIRFTSQRQPDSTTVDEEAFADARFSDHMFDVDAVLTTY
jgi:hypothetical protein